MQEELVLAGICLEQDEQSDPEEVRLSLEDVGVDYEAAEASQSGSSVAESEDVGGLWTGVQRD